MNFFAQQDHARRQTRVLVLLMALAVTVIVALVNGVAALAWHWLHGGVGRHAYPGGFFLTNTVVTAGLILGGTLLELLNLRAGGDVVAHMAGGRLVSSATYDARERRLQNVAAEMALASGIACPALYVLDKEESINAFAAGYNPNEAVVAVTRGALERLDRDELQGIVAHEFSHILNGDMRLNVRLIGVLYGLQMVSGFGQHLIDAALESSGLRGSRNFSFRTCLVVLGIALYVTGYIGVLLGRMIKAGVSRQREFLADASAVQFTRNRDGIGNALRKIGGLSRDGGPGSRIRHPNAEQLSHLFISNPLPRRIGGWFASHPPIAERLRRLYGRRIELLDAPVLEEITPESERLPDIPFGPTALAVPGRMQADVATDTGAAAHADRATHLPPELVNALCEPSAAACVVLALLLQRSRNGDLRALLQAHAPDQAEFVLYIAAALAKVPTTMHVALLDLAMPALTQLQDAKRRSLLKTVADIIHHDGRVSWHEFVLHTIITRRLGPQAGRAIPYKFAGLANLRAECALLLTLMVRLAHSGASISAGSAMQAQFLHACAQLPELQLLPGDFHSAAAISLESVQCALEHANCLMPLVKPALIKALCEAGKCEGELPPLCIDTLRAICSAIDAPLPPAVSRRVGCTARLEFA